MEHLGKLEGEFELNIVITLSHQKTQSKAMER